MEKIKITLVKSTIATKPATKATAQTLGLKKIGDSVVLPNDAASAGKVKVLSHLIKVETVD